MNKYQTIEVYYINKISSGSLKPGDKLPDLQSMCEQFGVSHITIQKALSELTKKGYITRIKCKGTFVNDGYTTDTVKPKNIALIISVIEQNDHSLLEIIKGAQSTATSINGNLRVEITDGSSENELSTIQSFLDSGIDGLLLYLNHEELAHKLLDLPGLPPYVMMDHYNTEYPCNSITPNNIDGGFLATDYLIKYGHTNIVFMSVNLERNTEKDRYTGYCNAMKSHGLKPLPTLQIDNTKASLALLLELTLEKKITAAFAVNDRAAMLILNYLVSNGASIPSDLSIIGFDDSFELSYSIVPLTTICQSFFEIGSSAVTLLYETIACKKEGMNHKKIFLPVRIVERNSVAQLKQEGY